MRETNISTKLREHIEGLPQDKPFTTMSLLRYGARSAIDKALSRMVKAGELLRAARGVYVKPRVNPYVGVVMPAPEEVAKAVAETQNAKLQIHGAEALRMLGMSTQESIQPVFLTDGPSRNLKMGNLNIKLKHTDTRAMTSLQGRPALALSSLIYLGRSQVNLEIMQAIKDKLSPSEYEELARARNSMPGWLSNMFAKTG